MKIEAHLIAWNEASIIGLVIKHYKKFCDHITIWDNYSSDETQLIAESMGCDVKKFGKKGELSDQAYLDVKNNCWKGSDADWVIIADCDEVLICLPCLYQTQLPGDRYAWSFMKGRLNFEANNGATIIKTYGWQIYSNQMPQNDLLDITTGWHFANYSKYVIFSPKGINEINYKPGAHACDPKGIVVYSENSPLHLLHYKNIGGVERLLKRNKEYRNRMSYQNRKMGWGIHYYDSEAKVRQEWIERLAKSKPLL